MKRGPGRWQRMILERLATSNGFLLVDLMRAELGFKLTPLMRKAAHAAAKDLEQKRLCRVVLESFEDRRGRQQRQAVIYRPGSGPVAFMDTAVVVEGAPKKVSAPAAHAPRTDNLTKLARRSSLGSEDEGDAVTDRHVYTEWLAGTWENGDPLAAKPGSPGYLAEQAEYAAKMAAADEALCPHCDDFLVITEVASGEHQRLCERCQIDWADPAQVAAHEAAEDAAFELRNRVLEPVLHDYADDLSPTTPTL
jgi:hypothetical protein